MSGPDRHRFYLNSAGVGLTCPDALARAAEYLTLEAELGPAAAASATSDEIAGVRRKAALLLGAKETEVAFSTSTTAAWRTVADALKLDGKRLLAATNEWGSNAEALRRLAHRTKGRLEVIPARDDGLPDLDALAAMIDGNVGGIFVPKVSSLTGRRYPVEAIGRVPRPGHCAYVVDAAQAVGQMPVDFAKTNCDALVATGRKWLRGPRGTAFVCLREGFMTHLRPLPFPDIALVASREGSGRDVAGIAPFDLLEYSAPLRIALGKAIETYLREGGNIHARLRLLTERIYVRSASAGLALLGTDRPQSGICTLCIPAAAKAGVAGALKGLGATVKWPDPVCEPLFDEVPGDTALLRLAPHAHVGPEDIDALFDEIVKHV